MSSIPERLNTVILCLGSNLGEREYLLKQASELIGERCGQITKASTIYETAAWGSDSTRQYLNQVLQIETRLSPLNLLQVILGIEMELGRERTGDKNADRLIDIDILFFNNLVTEAEHLSIPHPRLHERRFVLVPLNDIVPGLVHPVLHKSVRYLLEHCGDPLEVYPFEGRR